MAEKDEQFSFDKLKAYSNAVAGQGTEINPEDFCNMLNQIVQLMYKFGSAFGFAFSGEFLSFPHIDLRHHPEKRNYKAQR